MATLITPTENGQQQAVLTPTTQAIQDRRKAWDDLATRQFSATDDVYDNFKPASWQDYQYQKKGNFFTGFFKGVDEQKVKQGYQPTFGESLGAALTEFVRSGVEVYAEFTPEYKEARRAIEEVRKTDPEFADMIEESTIGKRLSNERLAIKGAAAVAEGALTVLPFFKVARTGLAAVEASNAARLAKFGKVGAALAKSPTFNNFATGGLYGAVFNGLYELHANDDADFKDVLKNVAIGGAFGGGLGGFGGIAVRTAARGTKIAGNALKSTAELISTNVPDWVKAPNNAVARKVYDTIFSTGRNIQAYYGDVGKNFVKMYKKAVAVANTDIGRIQLGLIDNGLVEPPSIAKKFFKNVKYVGDDAELMGYYNRVLRGHGAFEDPVVRARAIEADPRLQYLDMLRKDFGTKAQAGGVVESLLDLDTYLPKHTPDDASMLLSRSAKDKLTKAGTQAEREAIYAEANPVVKEMVENSVFNLKEFKTLEESYRAFYDYVDFVQRGGRVKLEDNTFLRRMVTRGEANSLEDAAGKIIADMKFKKSTLTPLASSLDFKRKVNLPWYDPNPARVLSVYSVDAAVRLQMAKTFGKDDEVIREMVGSIARDPKYGQDAVAESKKFENLVRTITGQVERSPLNERASALVRAVNIPKLAFAQILNVGQNLNTLLASDLGSTLHGLQVIFREERMRKAIESGVLLNNFMREIFSYSTGGQKWADNFLKYSGFSWTEMFNRAAGSVAAEKWATRNFAAYMEKNGLKTLSEAEAKSVSKMMLAAKEFEQRARLGAIDVMREFLTEFQQKFPEEDFTATAGNLGAVRKRLSKLDGAYESKIGKIQKAIEVLKQDLSAETKPLTDQYVQDLADSIALFRSEINRAQPPKVSIPDPNAPAPVVYSEAQIKEAVDAAVAMRRETMGRIIERLEEKWNEIRAVGGFPQDTPVFVPAAEEAAKLTPEEKLGQKVAGLNQEIKESESEVLRLTNEWAEKQRILEGIQDAYQISEKRLAKEFPEGLEYQKYMAKQRQNAIKRGLSEQAKVLTEKNGGVTISLQGDVPENGFAFARRKDTEFVVPQEKWTLENVSQYIDDHFDELQDENAFLGLWVDEGKVYTDVSTVLPDKNTALIEAKNADQLAIFDLENFNSIYVKDNEKTISDALLKGQVEGAVEGGIGAEAPLKGTAGRERAAEPAKVRLHKAEGVSRKLTPEEATLKELGIDLDEAKLRGFLAPDDLVNAAQAFVDATQFSGRSIDLPAFASSPMGKVLFQFKTFAYQQIRFLSNQIKKDLINKESRNFARGARTLLILTTVFPATGEVLGDIRSLLTGSKRPTRAFDRYMDNLANAGAYGLLWDFWKSAEIGKEAEFVVGVSVSEAMKFLEQTVVPTVKGDFNRAGNNFAKQLLQSTGVGRIGVNALYPSRKQGQSTLDSLREWVGYDEE